MNKEIRTTSDVNEKQEKQKQKIIISCFYNAGNSDLPVGFGWAETLLKQFINQYKVTILLHGQNIPFGLNNKVYQQTYNLNNPYISFFETLVKKYHLKIKICELCLTKDGFNNKQVLPYVKPVPFSVDYIIRSQQRGKIIIYDAKL